MKFLGKQNPNQSDSGNFIHCILRMELRFHDFDEGSPRMRLQSDAKRHEGPDGACLVFDGRGLEVIIVLIAHGL